MERNVSFSAAVCVSTTYVAEVMVAVQRAVKFRPKADAGKCTLSHNEKKRYLIC